MKKMEEALNRKKKEQTKAQSDVTHAKEAMTAEKRKLKEAEKSSKQVRLGGVSSHISVFLFK